MALFPHQDRSNMTWNIAAFLHVLPTSASNLYTLKVTGFTEVLINTLSSSWFWADVVSAVKVQTVLGWMLRGWRSLVWSRGGAARRGAVAKRPTLKVPGGFWLHQSLPHHPVLPCCCLPQHLQLLLHLPGGKEHGWLIKSYFFFGDSHSAVWLWF